MTTDNARAARTPRAEAGAPAGGGPDRKSAGGAEARSAKGRRTRLRLLDAGKAVFERDGFLKAKISDIAAEAGMSHGSFYHYFDSKEQIFREVAARVEDRLLDVDELERAEGDSRDPVARIRAANLWYLDAYRREAEIMRVIEEVSRYDDEVRAARVKRDKALADRIESAITRLQAQGRADGRVDGRYAAMALGGMVARFAEQMFVAGGAFEFDESVEQLTLLWANSIGLVPAHPED
ncbi:TetR/AcrR family transcriptional regulator [Actinomadura sp. CNU-125]|uniref:TetR/AcrR family transcriptional regulator n=1 Tax=Actinomadura sp. CNU-125 TaxID=1904961 RepID=UPI0009F8CA39|nr:TetR/AcrR family transcriptional regulator [Actinomadura sp. CNU-125]